MNPNLDKLHRYPFEKLAKLKAGVAPADKSPIALSIGEPKHPAPPFVEKALRDALPGLSVYPTTKGLAELRQAIADWARQRFSLTQIDPESQVLPVNGTREALFAFAQAVVTPGSDALVVTPNPFYQIYEGAALLAGAQPYYLNCDAENRFIPDFDAVSPDIWQRCQLLYLCSPGNPTGAVINSETLKKLIALADQYDFVIASDECYSEIYFDEQQPPAGLLQACAELGRNDYRRCVVFHSLSKRSNLPGLRSGFVAGDSEILSAFLLYRTYHGCAMPVHTQIASITAWGDEDHVRENREQYRQKFQLFEDILGDVLPLTRPDAGFYFWADITPAKCGDDKQFAVQLFAEQHITVLPGSLLGREQNGINPGDNRIRMALVAPLEECREAALRIRDFVLNQSNG